MPSGAQRITARTTSVTAWDMSLISPLVVSEAWRNANPRPTAQARMPM